MNNETSDQAFFKNFAIITVIFILFSIFITILSIVFASNPSKENHKDELISLIDKRTSPISNENLSSNPKIKSTIQLAAGAPSDASNSGEKIYKMVCGSCHDNGAAGSPITGNQSQWASRISEGIDHLYDSAINGIGIMPAKGGLASLSDEDVKAAVDYIIEKSK
tara:strand:- start:15342 stop:15836 length:495 start_codon:yes stop_codon:yes gene_type:complete